MSTYAIEKTGGVIMEVSAGPVFLLGQPMGKFDNTSLFVRASGIRRGSALSSENSVVL